MVLQRIKELEEMIASFPPDFYLLKKGLQAKLETIRVEVENNYVLRSQSVTWSVEDFSHRAKELQRVFPEKNLIFDETKYKEILEYMIIQHDSSIGICWETIDIYLTAYCLKE